MPPNGDDVTGVLFETDGQTGDLGLAKDLTKLKTTDGRKLELVWLNIILFVIAHTLSAYGLWLLLVESTWTTFFIFPATFVLSVVGISGGAHRLFAHRTFKVNKKLKLIFLFLNTLAFQDAVYYWARDHRLHHKYTETDADPYNSERGWWFAHIGWLCCRKHPEVTEKGRQIDLSDLKSDPMVMFQKKYYLILMPLICFVMPTVLPMWLWGETFRTSFCVMSLLRWVLCLNIVWLLNSSAHMFGTRFYDRNINPTNESLLIWFNLGEAYHNYHHVFPWDYKSAEVGHFANDFTTKFIEFFAKIGWAYDLKSVPIDLVKRRALRTGDGTHPIWGWGDKDQTKQDILETEINHQQKDNN
ncbi:acyl-CoA Delta(11) desaturase [Drosophila serrata]|uniref:acyl-CoA Delta(11) desaturase n=1 Tax=Drosophila serrata TaxID=7274 RepID=UPI000A1D36C5|nr:acyl-CoA Delta(11) desaturase [Drosophila serrata]